MLTDDDLHAIRDRQAQATLGPWEWCTARGGDHRLHQVRSRDHDRWLIAESALDAAQKSHEEQDANMAFIAHAREDIPALLAEVERLRDVNARLLNVSAAVVKDLSARIVARDELVQLVQALTELPGAVGWDGSPAACPWCGRQVHAGSRHARSCLITKARVLLAKGKA